MTEPLIFPEDAAIPLEHQLGAPVEQREYLIGGQIRLWDGPFETVYSPICDATTQKPRPIGHYPLLTGVEARAALAAATAAYDEGRGAWPTMTVADRIRHMEAFTFEMRAHRAEVVRLIMWEIGKTYGDATKEFDRTVEYIAATIDSLKELDRVSSRFTLEQGIMGQIRRAPLGVVLCMGPYNYPLNETFTTLIPALMMGNTVIFKPPRMGVLLHQPLLDAFAKAFPPGVVNTVYGDGPSVVGPLMESGQVDCLAFIGSAKVANLLKHQHPRVHRLRCVLGLGAKNAGIILPDADLETAVKECALGSLSYNGQRCTALKLLYVHKDIAEAFLTRFVAEVDALQAGMPWTPGVSLTPLPEPGKPEYLKRLVDDALAKGAKVYNREGGQISGTYFHPAVVYPVTPEMALHTVEQFGPIVPIAVFEDPADPVRQIVESDYGQQVSLFGRDPETLARLIDPLVNQVCRVNLNCQCQRGPDTFPFAGRKDSAEGTLSVSDALRVFSIRTLVAAKLTPENKAIVTQILHERRSNFLSTDFIL